ncbi:hypothetical protein B484DRAFT_390433 [Ochromonadaceae sp. CCMP2298]|nr:hypothetical protein B484DRAFT_390433 [Ochromonadaceae sp. CCMP2298]
MSVTGPDDIGISKTGFFAGSLGVFSSGMLFGVYRVMRKEDAKLSHIAQRSQVMLAMRALGWGTVLCLGSFMGAGALFSYTTKVTTFQGFDHWMKGIGTGLNIPTPHAPKDAAAAAADILEVQQLEKDMEDFINTVWTGEEAGAGEKGVGGSAETTK